MVEPVDEWGRAAKQSIGRHRTVQLGCKPLAVEVRGATLSFAFRDLHPPDVSQVLDQANVYVRAGHHCAKPLMRVLGVGATCRASFYLYNDRTDADALVDALAAANDIFGP